MRLAHPLTTSVISRWLARGATTSSTWWAATTESGVPHRRGFADRNGLASRFIAGVTSAFLSASTFIVVLWTIGGALTITLGGSTVTIPGFLVIAAVIYAAIASGSIMTIGRRFVQTPRTRTRRRRSFAIVHACARTARASRRSVAEEEERDGIEQHLSRRAADPGVSASSAYAHHADSGIVLDFTGVVPLLCAPRSFYLSTTPGQATQESSAFTIVQKPGVRAAVRDDRGRPGALRAPHCIADGIA